MIRSYRLQITTWYLALFSLLFVVFSIFLYGTVARALRNRLDEALVAESRTAAALFQGELQELAGDEPAAAAETVAELQIRGYVIAVFSDRRLLSSNTPAPPDILLGLARAAAAMPPEAALPVARYGPAGGRATVYRFESGGRPYSVIVLGSLEPVAADLAIIRRVLYIGLPLLILVAGFGGFWLATRSLRPLRVMAEQAHGITGRNLSKRLEIGPSSEELAALAQTFNELLARLDTSFETMRRFIADASHELRTPIAVIRGEADVALGRNRSPAEYRESLAVIQDEAKRLTRLVGDLLNLARADAGHCRIEVREVYLNDLVAECCRSVQALAAAGNVALECRGGGDAAYRGDEELLRRMVLNLLDNAIRYTPAGGKVVAAVEREDAAVRILVSDTGLGIPPEAAPHVFERFYRVDGARSRQEGGFGLGLAIVKWVAESHHGRVELSSVPVAGSTFTVLLPE
jgi:two-component system, OmpR family, sensor kinase